MDAIYLLSPQPHIVDCLIADFDKRRYARSFLVWTSVLDPALRRRIDSSQAAQQQLAGDFLNSPALSSKLLVVPFPLTHTPHLAGFETLTIDYFPRESHLVTFRDPWSFPILYHPACNNLVPEHLRILAHKVCSSVSLSPSPPPFSCC